MNKCLKCQNIINSDEVYGLHQDCFAKSFGLTQPQAFKDLDPKKEPSTPSSTEIKKNKTTFFHGRYQKYSANLGEISYILKVQEDPFPELPVVEYVCNQIAEILGIDVPRYQLINYNGKITFVTRNFMQDYIGTLHHIYKFLPPGEENPSCEQLIKIIFEQTGRLADVAKFIGICLFDALIGNNDRHGRNLGIIDTASIKKLAPMYDNPSCIGTEDHHFLVSDIDPSGSIWTSKSKSPKLRDYIEEFTKLGHKDIVDGFRIKVLSRSSQIITIVENSELSEKRKTALVRLIEKRMGVLKND